MLQRLMMYAKYRNQMLRLASDLKYQQQHVTFVYPWSEIGVCDTALVCCLDCAAHPGDQYVVIAKTNHIVVYEKIALAKKTLRSGVPSALVQELMKYVTHTFAAMVNNTPPTPFPHELEEQYREYLYETCTVDLTLWYKGKMHGSQVIESTLHAAITKLPERVYRDVRFKALTPQELPHVQLELILSPNVWVPFLYIEGDQNEPVIGVNYRLVCSGNNVAWFFANVANQATFPTLKALSIELAKKAGSDTSQGILSSSIAFSYLGSTDHEKTLRLYGPLKLAVLDSDPESVDCDSTLLLYGPQKLSDLDSDFSAHTIARHIAATVDSRGFAPIPIRAGSAFQGDQDIVRLSFLYRALAEYEFYTQDDTVHMRATSIRTYVSEQFAYIPSRQQLLTACYLLQGDYFMRSTRDDALYTFLTAHKKDISVDAEIIDVFELIQTALTCALWDYTGERIYIDQAITQGSSLWNIKKNVWSPVVFTDLPLLLWASERTQAYQMMYEHLRSLLGRDGVLYSAQGALTYTQGVGKIMEVWAGIPDPKELVTQLSVWLASMQYTKDTVHCVAPEASAIVMRGFRCSYWNRDVWLDASAHILIGLSRLDHAQAHRSHWQTLVR